MTIAVLENADAPSGKLALVIKKPARTTVMAYTMGIEATVRKRPRSSTMSATSSEPMTRNAR